LQIEAFFEIYPKRVAQVKIMLLLSEMNCQQLQVWDQTMVLDIFVIYCSLL